MANLQELTTYKAKLMETICSSQTIANLLNVTGKEIAPIGKPLAYSQVFPYSYVPSVTENAEAFICFKIDVPSIINDTVKTVQVTVYTMCEKKLMRMTDGSGIRIDLLASEVDKLLNGSSKFGLGNMDLVSVHEFTPIDGYYGNVLCYRVQDINRSLCGV